MVSTVPLSWSFLQQFGPQKPPLINMGRSESMLRDYQKWRQELTCSAVENIHQLYFQKGQRFNLARNSFPYFLDGGIIHYVLWIDRKNGLEDFGKIESQEDPSDIVGQEMEGARKHICDNLFGGSREKMEENCVYFQNVLKLRSIKEIPHIHCFVRM